VLLSPVIAVAAVFICLETQGSPIFVQSRVGRGGRAFQLYKLRSMVSDASAQGSYITGRADVRVTKVGRWLRATSLDELPQLWNVFKGDMSLVGPRPDVPQQQANYTEDEWRIRTSVLPGITGLAQATLRSEASPEERKRLDLEYCRRRSLRLDCLIIVLTVRQMWSKGSY